MNKSIEVSAMSLPRTGIVLLAGLIVLGAHSRSGVPAAADERENQSEREQVPSGQNDETSVSKALRDILALKEEGLRICKNRLKSVEDLKKSGREMNEAAMASRKQLQQLRESARPEDEARYDENLSTAEAHEHATREAMTADDAEVVASTAHVAQAEAALAVAGAMLDLLNDPGQEAAVTTAQTRLSECRIRTAEADEKAAEAGVRAAEAKLAALKKKLEAAKSQSKRVRAREAGSQPGTGACEG